MSADLGNQEARSILATIYEYGGYIWIKKGVVHQNYKLAYVWYALSMGELYDPKDLQFFADRHLTAAELSDANNLLREWRPGQCEKDLGLVSHTESKY
jgi:TPR repeat protein